MLRGFFGNLIFAIIARMLCGNRLNHVVRMFLKGARAFRHNEQLNNVTNVTKTTETVHFNKRFC